MTSFVEYVADQIRKVFVPNLHMNPNPIRDVPKEIRDASHNLSNESAKLRACVRLMNDETDKFDKLLEAMRGHR